MSPGPFCLGKWNQLASTLCKIMFPHGTMYSSNNYNMHTKKHHTNISQFSLHALNLNWLPVMRYYLYSLSGCCWPCGVVRVETSLLQTTCPAQLNSSRVMHSIDPLTHINYWEIFSFKLLLNNLMSKIDLSRCHKIVRGEDKYLSNQAVYFLKTELTCLCLVHGSF